MRTPKTFDELGSILSDLDRRLKYFEGVPNRPNIELHARRVINAGDGIDGGDYVTIRQLRRLLSELENTQINRTIEIPDGGGDGDNVFVNNVDVLDPNFNDDWPDPPTGYSNVIWQHDPSTNKVSAHYETPSDSSIVRGGGGVWGAILNQRPNQPSFTPFGSTTAATPLAQTESWICPAPGYVCSPRIYLGGAETSNGIAQHMGFDRNGSFAWGGVIQPQSAVGAHGTASEIEIMRIERGEQLMGAFHANGGSDNTSFGLWSAEFIGDGGEIIMGGPALGNAGATGYFGPFRAGADTTEANMRMPMIAGTLKWAYIKLNATLTGNAGESAVITVLKNGSATSVVITVPVDGAGTADGGMDNSVWADLTNTATFADGDTLSFEVTVSHASVAAVAGQLSFAFVPTNPSVLVGGALGDNLGATTIYMAPWCKASGAWNQTEANTVLVMPRAGTIATGDFRLYLKTAPTGVSVQTWTVRKNGSDTSAVISLTSGTSTGTVVSTGSSVSFAKGDRFSISNVNSGGATGYVAGWSVEFT